MAWTAWCRRQELFVIPWLWREARDLSQLRDQHPNAPAFEGRLNRGLNRLDWALSELIRLQHPDFLGGVGFGLVPMRSSEGGTRFVAHCEPLDYAFDKPVEEGEGISVSFCGCRIDSLHLLDARGRLAGKPIAAEVWLGGHRGPYTQIEGPPGAGDVLRISARADCLRCLSNRSVAAAETELAIDADGFIPHGLVTADLGAPICPRDSNRQPEPDDAEISRLLASSRAGDLHRALTLLERVGAELIERVEALMDHEDPLIRARAVALVGRHRSHAPELKRFVRDHDPRVRFAAVEAVSGTPGWEAAVLALTGDEEPRVARRVWLELVLSSDPAVAEQAAFELVGLRETYVQYLRHCPFASARLADAILTWLEEDPGPQDLSSLEHTLSRAYSPEMLRPLAGRLLALWKVRAARGDPVYEIARALVRADDPLADDALLEALSGKDPGEKAPVVATLEELLGRARPASSPRARELLEQVMRTGGPCSRGDVEDCRQLAALLLIRQGSVQAALRLVASCAADGDPGFPLLEAQAVWSRWMAASHDCETDANLNLPTLSGKEFR